MNKKYKNFFDKTKDELIKRIGYTNITDKEKDTAIMLCGGEMLLEAARYVNNITGGDILEENPEKYIMPIKVISQEEASQIYPKKEKFMG